MNRLTLKTSLLTLSVFIVFGLQAREKKRIIINEDLIKNAEVFQVKTGAQWVRKTFKYKFGGYEIVDSKNKATKSEGSSNFLSTQSETKSENQFSFILKDPESDSVMVNAVAQTTIKELQSINLITIEHFSYYIGEDELLLDAKIFSSIIHTASKPDEVWFLALDKSDGTESGKIHEGILSNNHRNIQIKPVSSLKEGENNPLFFALGYEFIENGKSLCALQYFSGVNMNGLQNIIWLRTDLDPQTKRILAGAMTSIIQFKRSTGF